MGQQIYSGITKCNPAAESILNPKTVLEFVIIELSPSKKQMFISTNVSLLDSKYYYTSTDKPDEILGQRRHLWLDFQKNKKLDYVIFINDEFLMYKQNLVFCSNCFCPGPIMHECKPDTKNFNTKIIDIVRLLFKPLLIEDESIVEIHWLE